MAERGENRDEFGRAPYDSYQGQQHSSHSSSNANQFRRGDINQDRHQRHDHYDDTAPGDGKGEDDRRFSRNSNDMDRRGMNHNNNNNNNNNVLQVGTVIRGQVSRIETYGAFVDFANRQRGLVHISQLAPHHVEKVEDICQLHQDVYAVVLELDDARIRLSMRNVNQETGDLTGPIEEDNRRGTSHNNNNHNNNGLQVGTVVRGQVSRVETYGAFVDFANRQRGLVHISQLAPHHVEKVEDICQMHQDVYAVVLEMDDSRIRLSMRNVNQETGDLTGPIEEGNHRGRGGGGGGRQKFEPNPDSDRRARQRQMLLKSSAASWRSTVRNDNENDNSLATNHNRLLWGRSPSPPAKEQAAAAKKKPPARRESDESDGSSSSSDSSSSSSSSDDSSEDERRRRRQKKRRGGSSRSNDKRRRRRRRSPSTSSSSSSSSADNSKQASDKEDELDLQVKDEQPSVAPAPAGVEPVGPMDEQDLKDAQAFKKAVQGNDEEDSDDDMGPMPLPQSNAADSANNKSGSAYGGALLPGEGQAIAAYVQQNLRIPRRGEIGYSGDAIEGYEHSGYVMSGSRHARMNAVRIRKENQVYSAEEQRALALITMEENQQKESQLMEDFRVMLKGKAKAREQQQAAATKEKEGK